jgi:HemY protein
MGMRGIVWLLLLSIVATVAAITLGSNDGLVTLHWGVWRVDLSLNLFVLLVVGACLLVIAAARVFDALVSLPRRAAEWRALQRERAAHQALREAYLEMAAGRYSRADKAAQRVLGLTEGAREDDGGRPPGRWARPGAAGGSRDEVVSVDVQGLRPEGPAPSPDRLAQGAGPVVPGFAQLRLTACLLSADSLHRLQNRQARDRRLQQALTLAEQAGSRGGTEAARLMAAGWAVEDRDVEEAQRWLGALPPGVARRTQALRLKLQAARLAGRGEEALQTARLLAKHQAFSPVAAQGLLHSLASQMLDSAHDIEQLRRQWQALDAADRRDPLVVDHAVRRAVALGAPQEARAWLRPLWERIDALAREDRERVALSLAEALEGLGADWLAPLEQALAAHPDDSAIAAVVGLALAERGLWGKARGPLELVTRHPEVPPRIRRRAWRELARVARGEGDEARALACEQAAAQVE